MGNKSLNAFIEYEYKRVKGEPCADLFKSLRAAQPGASAVTKRYVYERLLWHIKEKAGDRLVFPSQDTMAGTLAIDARTVRRALPGLEADGLIYPGVRNERTKGVTSTVYYVVDVIGERAALEQWKASATRDLRKVEAARLECEHPDDVPLVDEGWLRAKVQKAVEDARAHFKAAHPDAYATDGRILQIVTGTRPEDLPVYKSFRENAAAKKQAKGRIRDAAAERGVEDPDRFAEDVVASMGSGVAQSKRAIDEFVNDGRLEERLPAPVERPYLLVAHASDSPEPQEPPAWLGEDHDAIGGSVVPLRGSAPMPPEMRAQVDALRSA
jgi:hypothetical protein